MTRLLCSLWLFLTCLLLQAGPAPPVVDSFTSATPSGTAFLNYDYDVQNEPLEIDNNLCENAIRPTAVGKKNFLFVGHPEAGQCSAVIYSVLASCRRHGVNPAEYLQDIFQRLPKAKTSELKSLTPAAWAKAKRSAS